jgi:molecular chaperone HtpG
MSNDLISYAEKKAEEATRLPAFSAIKLDHVKREVSEMLRLIGSNSFFGEYSKHDITHVNNLLSSLDWIIPPTTKSSLSGADWLLIVLGIYFHDLGMLITREEYDDRAKSSFNNFKSEILFSGAEAEDYKSKVVKLGVENAERFFYQEFVRFHHAERIKAWIMGQDKPLLGVAEATSREVTKLMEAWKPQFRKDLALICESHHLNDLYDVEKYRISQPYGNSAEQTGNVQYAAVILRTADILHMTSDRTPSVAFKLINPVDPISQQEWAKQLAVDSVRPKITLNDEGVADEKLPKDTIEIFANFRSENGFFGLNSYISYVSNQLKRSHEWIEATRKKKLSAFEFPWKRIDDSNITTEGFIREAFEFTIDQEKVLDLLTGHTLYNDSKVVLRELIQNSLDAVRLEFFPSDAAAKGKIVITWDEENRVLSVLDNGTGMDQSIISNFLLKVGSSRYQDPEFSKKHPNFSSISRFGIGVLSAFMISDEVEILTVHPAELEARHLTLRSVHGKYLVRLLDKEQESVSEIGLHGTKFSLRVRESVDIGDIGQILRHWVVFPECKVSYIHKGKQEESIGYQGPREMLRDLLTSGDNILDFDNQDVGIPSEPKKRVLRVLERDLDGVRMAFAVKWSPYFLTWEFLPLPDADRYSGESSSDTLKLGVCIEGIRVESGCPGFRKQGLYAVANVTGKEAPKTNVARSGLEATAERELMLYKFYKIYGDHVVEELDSLKDQRGYSLTWAAQEARLMMHGLGNENFLSSNVAYERMFSDLKINLIEEDGERKVVSAGDIKERAELWTIDCQMIRSAEYLIREVKGSKSLSKVVEAAGLGPLLPEGSAMYCGSGRYYADDICLREREVSGIRIDKHLRRVDLRWSPKESPRRWDVLASSSRWLESVASESARRRMSYGDFQLAPRGPLFLVAARELPCEGTKGFGGVRTGHQTLILSGSVIGGRMIEFNKRIEKAPEIEGDLEAYVSIAVLAMAIKNQDSNLDHEEFIVRAVANLASHFMSGFDEKDFLSSIDINELVKIISNMEDVFDASAWRRDNY